MDNVTINKTWIQGVTPDKDDLKEYDFYQGENLAHTFVISGKTTANATVQITGTIRAIYLGENKTVVPMDGTISEGKAVVTLDELCYAIPGRFVLSIYAKNGDVNQCIYCGIGHMFRTESESIAYRAEDYLEFVDNIDDLNDYINSPLKKLFPGDVMAHQLDYASLWDGENTFKLKLTIIRATTPSGERYGARMEWVADT